VTKTWKLRAAFLGALSLTCAACLEDEGGDTTQAEAIDVCALVSREEAAATLGKTVLEGQRSVANFVQFTCAWDAEDDFGEISVEVRAGDPKRFTEFYEYGDPGEPVQGIGDRAEWDPTYGLEVLTSDYFVQVFTVNFSLDDSERLARSVELAKAVLSRLPAR
jgi:hypothetical protein